MDLVKAKLVKPGIPGDVIIRRRLTDRIAASGHRMVLLNAPSGYGKTVLMTQIHLTRNEIALWYHIDDTDNSFRQFLTYMGSALEPYFPGTVQNLADLLTLPPDVLLPDAAAGRFLDILEAASGRITLFLDDIHMVESPAAQSFIRYLARYAGRGFRIVMSTERPISGLDELPLDRRPLELGVQDLRFSREETELYLENSVPLPDGFPLEGWAFGLSILKRNGVGELREELELLAHQVSSSLTPNEKDLLSVVSNFPNASPALCDAVLDDTAAAEGLEQLLNKGVFLTESDGTYSLHPAIGGVLRQQLVLTPPQRQAALGVLMREGQYPRAMGVALENGDGESAIRVLKETRYALLSLARADRIRYFYSLLPKALLEQHPPLHLLAAAGALLRNEAVVWTHLEAAYAYFEQTADGEGAIFTGLLRSAALRREHRYDEAVEVVSDVFESASTHPIAQVDLLGEVAALADPAPMAMRPFIGWREKLYSTMGDRIEDPSSLRLLSHLSLWYVRDGYPEKAWEVHSILSSRFGDYGPSADLLLQRFHMGGVDEAAALFQEALHRDDPGLPDGLAPNQPGRAPYLLGLGLCLRISGSTEEAIRNFDRGRQIARMEDDDVTALQCELEKIRLLAIQDGEENGVETAENIRLTLDPSDLDKMDMTEALLATLHLLDGKTETATGYAQSVLSRMKPEQMRYPVLEATLVLASIQIGKGDKTQAQNLLVRIPPAYMPLSAAWLNEHQSCAPALIGHLNAQRDSGGAHARIGTVTRISVADSQEPKALTIHCLGDLRVEADGVPIRWRTHRARDLFFYLALHRGVKLNRSNLVETIFPHATDEQMTHQVKNTLSLLRRGLGKAGFDHMLMAVGGEYWLDGERLQGDYFSLVNKLRELPEMDQEKRFEALSEACALYAGELCKGLDFPLLPRLRKNIRGQMESALLKEIQDLVTARALPEALHFAEELCRISPDNDTYSSVREALSERTHKAS